MIQALFIEIPLFWTLPLPLLAILVYFLITLVLKPYLMVRSYQNQGFITEFKPIVSTFPLEVQNVRLRNQFYARMIDMCSMAKRPLGLVRNIGKSCVVMLFDGQMIKEMFMDKVSFVKHPFQHSILQSLSYYALTLLEGPVWKKHRKVISKGFDYEKIDALIPIIINSTKQKIQSLGAKKQIPDIMNFYKELAGSIMGKAYFGYDLNKKLVEGIPLTLYLSDTISLIGKLSYSPFFCATNLTVVKLGLIKQHRQVISRIKILREAIKQIVEECTKQQSWKNCANFSMWKLFSEGSQAQSFNKEEMVDEFITFFSEGVYTTGLFMTMLTYYLINNTAWKTKLQEEVLAHISPKQGALNQKLLQNLPVLSGVLKQTLRLAPPVVNGIERIATRDTTFSNGIKIKKDTMVMACHLVNHIDGRYHDDPLKFDPSRWDQNTKTTTTLKQNPGCFIPFSIGQRNCPGQKFAQIQTAIVVTSILSAFDVKLSDPNYKLQFTQKFLREPLNPIACQFTLKEQC